MIKVPWNQLRHCDMGRCSTNHCVDLLRHMPKLEKWKVWLEGMTPINPHPYVQLPHLRSITIQGNPSFLSMLLVPELEEINIRFGNDSWTTTPQLVSLFSGCSVRSFSLRPTFGRHHPTGDDMIQILQASPALVNLHLGGCVSKCMTKSFLTQFAFCTGSDNSASKRLVPMLHSMKVDYVPEHFELLEFADAIQSRMTLGALKTVEIYWDDLHMLDDNDIFDTESLLRLQQLRDTGLDIRFHTYDRDLLN